jgi:predicted nuclease of predicted toxin-antitoxin system
MKFLLDENFPKFAKHLLEARGHEAFDVRGTTDQGITDPEIFTKAQDLGAVFLTTDRDFWHTIPHLHDSHCGVIVIALRQPNRNSIVKRLEWILSQMEPHDFSNRVFHLRDKTWISHPPM